ncbi:Glyoxylate/hydroxypyruvate reductase A [Nymphon striatum]|nr:Glyoxylate/hydroxypyruvate reductase A [Nymphon striatum]
MSKSTLLLSVDFTAAEKLGSVHDGLGGRPVIDWTKGERPESLAGIKYALVWDFDHDLFDRMPDLEVIFSAGAGVDKVLSNPAFAKEHTDCALCRSFADNANERMDLYAASDVNVGIMGLGVLGQDSAHKLNALGFNVLGWSRTKKEIEGVECFDEAGLDAFLSQSHYLVGLLPLTAGTTGIFNRDLFTKLAKHPVLASPVFINGGRGKSQVEVDIASCLEDGTLGAVSLDVFENEPLSADSPLWHFENAYIFPHVAASSDVMSLGRYVDGQIERYENGDGLENLVDLSLGY